MWTEISEHAEPSFIDCRPPFSFYFDLVQRFWRGPPHPANVALHRLCTLARKMGVQSVVTCSGFQRDVVREEISDLDASAGGGGEAEAIDFCFFSDLIESPSRLPKADPASLLGRATVINYRAPGCASFTHSYVFDAIFRAPGLRSTAGGTDRELLNNYIHTRRRYDVDVSDCTFSLSGVYFCQQNGVTSACAHACLRMALNSMDPSIPFVTNRQINAQLDLEPPVGGLSQEQIKQVLAEVGLQPFVFNFRGDRPDSRYIPTLYSVVESGYPALLVFATARPNEAHVVPVLGHTLNSDEWHPYAQATPEYSGPESARFYSSSAWADHFVVNDDNFGPYYCLSSIAFTGAERSPSAPWALMPLAVIGLLPESIQCAGLEVEGVATSWLHATVERLQHEGRGAWWKYMASGKWTYLLRTFLIDSTVYRAHLTSSKGHDGSSLRADEIRYFVSDLPERFWISEFSMSGLYTGNKSKLGEILTDATRPVDPDSARMFDSVIAMRAPSLLIRHRGRGRIDYSPASLESHSPLYRRIDAGFEW